MSFRQGARQFFERRGGGGWKNPYVTDGLIAMWDGEWNAGPGVHNDGAETWIDVTGNGNDAVIVKSENYSRAAPFDAQAARMDGTFCFSFTPSTAVKNAVVGANTIEIVARLATPSLTDGTPFFGFGNYRNRAMTMTGRSDTLKYIIGTAGEIQFIAPQAPAGNFAVTKSVSGTAAVVNCYHKGEFKQTNTTTTWNTTIGAGELFGISKNMFGGSGRYWNSGQDGFAFALRFYNRALTAEEIASNWAVDAERFTET